MLTQFTNPDALHLHNVALCMLHPVGPLFALPASITARWAMPAAISG